jgi:hypothetical protein
MEIQFFQHSKETAFSPLCVLDMVVEDQMIIECEFISGIPILFNWSICFCASAMLSYSSGAED